MFKLSVILNYGCPFGCSYCIWQNHKLSDNLSSCFSFNFSKLQSIIQHEDNHELVSISGGGDPLFNSDNPESDQYQLLMNIIKLLKNQGKRVSVHTRYRKIPNDFLFLIDQFVLSYDDLEEPGFRDFVIKLNQGVKVIRIAKVMMDTNYNYERDISFAQKNDIQITFYPFNKDKSLLSLSKTLSAKINSYNKLKVVTEGNLKVYYMPDNEVYDDYGAKDIYYP